VLLGFWIILFRNLLTGASWLYDDFPYVYYPGKVLAAVSLAKGIMPFWNPYSFGGMPFLADPQIAIFYPITYLLKYFVSGDMLSPLVVQIAVLIHFLIVSVSTYFLGKELKFNNFASLIFALMFSFSSFTILHVIHMNILETAMWLPLIYLLFLKFENTGKWNYVLINGLVMAVCIFAGYPQSYFFIMIFMGALILQRIYSRYKTKDFSFIKKSIGAFAIFCVIAFGTASIQLTLTNEFSQNTERTNIGYDFAKQGSMHPYDLLTMLVPKIFGTFNWNQDSKELTYWSVQKSGGHQEGAWMYTVSTTYVTLLALILLIPAIRMAYQKKITGLPVLFLSISAILALLFGFGGNFFLHKLFFDYVPLFNKFRNPAHGMFIFVFVFALLASYSLNALMTDKKKFAAYFSNKYLLILGSIALLLFIMGNAGTFKSIFPLAANPEINSWIASQVNLFFVLAALYIGALYLYMNDKVNINIFSVTLTAIILLDIYLFAFNQNNGSSNPADMYKQNASLISRMKEEGKSEVFRINMRDGGNMLFQRYQGALDRIQLLEGINVLKLERTFPPNKPDSNSTQSYDLMNVKYRIKVDNAKKQMGLVPSETYLPRAKMFYRVKVISGEEDIKNYMQSNEFDYRKTIVIEKQPPGMNIPALKDSESVANKVNITEYDLNKITLDVETSENGFLFLSEIYYPEWKAYIDDKENEIFRTDYSLRSVYVEKGHHTIRLVYDSDKYNTYSKVSLFTLLLTLASIGVITFKNKRMF